jgi:putative molybdopterin biosynthesis protein
MAIYLKDIPLETAQAKLDEVLKLNGLGGILGKEAIPLDENAVGRVVAEPVWAKISSPHYHASAMDGFAVRAKETAGASLTNPVILELGAQAEYVDTGDPLPEKFDAVIMIEATEPLNKNGKISTTPRKPDSIRIRQSVAPWQHVRPMGEDMIQTQLVHPTGKVLSPVDLGAIAGSGHQQVVVARKPKVAIIPTGTELVPVGQKAEVGEIIEYNSIMLAAQINEWGGEAFRFEITADEYDLIRTQVRKAVEGFDLVLVNAGSSAGSEDFTAQIVEDLGELLVHGIAIRPGHPVILGVIKRDSGKAVPIIGVPGYPVSAALTGEIFIEPLIARWLGRAPVYRDEIEAELTRKITSPAGDDDFMRVAVGRVGERTLAAPLSRGAGVISSLVRADGIAVIPKGSQGESEGTKVNVKLYRNRKEIEETIFMIGSHDMTIDILAQFMAGSGRRLVSANAGSLGGLAALRKGYAHLAGIHLLDPKSGEYNLPYLDEYLPDTPVTLIGMVNRKQGLMVRKGNPEKIKDIADVVNRRLRYANRQRGAGTRILLDYELEQLGMDPQAMLGYDQVEFTHLNIAASVVSGRADCGLGIAAAAEALELDFIPLYDEQYDLAIPSEYYDDELLQPLLDTLQSKELHDAILSLPGYSIENIGKVWKK